MKTTFTITLLALIMGCGDDGVNAVETNPVPFSLNGEWTLKAIMCECIISDDYEDNQIWVFDTINSIVEVRNSKSFSHHLIYEEGTYDYEIIDSTISILGIRSYPISIFKDRITIGTSVVDDVQMHFGRD
ncbi:MAG: hypothetical protein Kapaf2KO_13380 [Candidatus Kapaibacteriales bacterium]